MTEETITIPKGYWADAEGALIPVSKIKDIDKDRHRTVSDLCEAAKKQRDELISFKTAAMLELSEFINRSLAEYDVKTGGKKGNVTLFSFDGRYKVVRQVQDTLMFDERLMAAKVLIDECIQGWSKGSNANIKVLVNDAFQVDQQGKINKDRVLGLRRLKIEDETWRRAMDAISDSIKVASSKPYIRFYERDASDAYRPIVLDVAAL
ncbi:DUF3164 family protein [Paracidovorax citrulli]|uniref:DUF3164 family protein n=2 Tax=Paracidovorax citrulli TaxID=80869 RepID=A1TUM9_PARC0|nr:DUF3164 family protein [Paracidovorax citrulli]ABM34667.1 conserved hypothetical protein [Paracidovorax citrulli AAC00-1]ATG96751.1 DUF3164 domain-containing protein [Paracidovorax citrulli]MVT28741.1 DUF3164 family protein [Paracidovorax citrulli]MVT37398.1 DUF3164 family protein [Paracidovorax citrulli]PVY64113.1 uncharacterized protein DUF3164 [Paracidovorax citrulli]